MAGLTVIDNEEGNFRVEGKAHVLYEKDETSGCASDIDWLGPFHRNRPEFYFKIRHNCKSTRFVSYISVSCCIILSHEAKRTSDRWGQRMLLSPVTADMHTDQPSESS